MDNIVRRRNYCSVLRHGIIIDPDSLNSLAVYGFAITKVLTNYCVYATICYVMIYNRVQLLRVEAKMTRQQLADQVGVNYQTIGFIERGDYSPSLELAFALADVFKVRLDDIFSNHEFKLLIVKE